LNNTRHSFPRRRLSVLATAAVLTAVAGCTGGSPTGPVIPTGTDPSPAAPSTPAGEVTASNGRIQLLDVAPGKTASFLTQPGKQLTVIASAASYAPPTPSFRLSVGGGSTAAASAYGVLGTAPRSTVEMPYSARFTATNESAVRANGGKAPTGPRRLQAATEREVGTTEKFWVNTGNSSSGGDVQRTAKLERKTEHAYFYVDTEAQTISQANLDRLASEFEDKIYPRVTAVFGPESKPGVDGDGRLFIVVSPAVDNFGKEKGLMGYFWSRDMLPASGAGSHSNQKEALFMTDKLFDYPELTSFGTLAHEFQHLINFSQKAIRSGYTMVEETWLDEGLAMYAMEVAGYGLPAGDKHIAKDLNEFQQTPSAYSLTDWSGNPHGFSYGQSYLFVRYMVDRHGPGVIKEILQATKAGQDGLDQVLAKRQATFAGFFRDWTIANLISGTPLAAGTAYQYKGLDLAGSYGGFDLAGFKTTPATSAEVTAGLRPWGSAYYTFDANQQKAWELKLGDGGATRLLGAAIVP
jgi:hypothetical protein